MIPNVIAALANALRAEFAIEFDDAVRAAWSISRQLDANGVLLKDKEPEQ